MTNDIIAKLRRELQEPIQSERQVVYLLVEVRKLIHQLNSQEKHTLLSFYCSWAVHIQMGRGEAKRLLCLFDRFHDLQNKQADIPHELEQQIDNITKLRGLKSSLTAFLREYELPTNILLSHWGCFMHCYASVIQDCPLEIEAPRKPSAGARNSPSKPKHLKSVVVRAEIGKLQVRDDYPYQPYRIIWTFNDKNGHSGDIDIYNSIP